MALGDLDQASVCTKFKAEQKQPNKTDATLAHLTQRVEILKIGVKIDLTLGQLYKKKLSQTKKKGEKATVH